MIDLSKLALISSRQVANENAAIGRGTYFVFFDSGQLLLERSGYLEFDTRFPHSQDGYDLLYVGATLGDLRTRVLTHLRGDTRASSLRMTVGALLTIRLGLEPVSSAARSHFHFGDGEERLTRWLLQHTKVALLPNDDPFGIEKSVLATTPVPFNISERKRHPYSKYLMTLRSFFAARPSAAARMIDLVSVGTHQLEGARQ